MKKNGLSRRSVMIGAAASVAAPTSRQSLAERRDNHEVEIRSFKFDPEIVQVRIGDTIRWTNRDLAPHTATAVEFGWDTQALEQNETGEVLVTEGMETSYFCMFHPHMKGRIEIVSG